MKRAFFLVLMSGSSLSGGAFQTSWQVSHSHNHQSALFSSNYLDSLGGTSPVQQDQPQAFSAPFITNNPITSSAHGSLSYASATYFSLSNLASKGPRATADWGTPEDGTRTLVDDGTFRVGSWYCTPGGWPSPNSKAHTEIFYMLAGHGCLEDSDGIKHLFGPGDTVVIPKGHTGRWDVFETIHKVWAVNEHAFVEEPGPVIRVHVEHYHQSAPQYLTPHRGSSQKQDPLYGTVTDSTLSASRTFYKVGPTQVGVWVADGSFWVPNNGPTTPRRFFHLVEGVVVLTEGDTGKARRCVPGDTVVLQAGWYGHVDIIEPVKKIWTTAN